MGGKGSGRKKTPTATKAIRGRPRRDRRNDAEPVPAIGDVACPSDLSDGAREVWRRLAPDLVVKKVLTPWDVDAFALLCDAIDRSDQARSALDSEGMVIEAPVFDRNGNLTGSRRQPSPWWRIWKDANADALRAGARFGWTPADRAALKVGDGDANDPDADLLTG